MGGQDSRLVGFLPVDVARYSSPLASGRCPSAPACSYHAAAHVRRLHDPACRPSRLSHVQQMAGLIKELRSTPRGNANPVSIKLGMVGGEHCSPRRGSVLRRVPTRPGVDRIPPRRCPWCPSGMHARGRKN